MGRERVELKYEISPLTQGLMKSKVRFVKEIIVCNYYEIRKDRKNNVSNFIF